MKARELAQNGMNNSVRLRECVYMYFVFSEGREYNIRRCLNIGDGVVAAVEDGIFHTRVTRIKYFLFGILRLAPFGPVLLEIYI